MAISFKCPECNAVLKSPTAIPVGKQVKCPKCAKPFAMPAPLEETAVQAAAPPPKPAAVATPKPKPPALEETTEYEPVKDDYEPVQDDYEAVDDEPAKPAAKKKVEKEEPPEDDEDDKPRKKKKARAADDDDDPAADDDRPLKKKKGERRYPAALVYSLMVLGFGLVVLSLAGTMYYILADIKVQASDTLVYLPANSNVLFGMNFESFWKTKLGEQARQTANSQANLDLQATGLKVEDMMHEMVVGGYANPNSPGGGLNQKVVVVIKTRVPFDKDKVAASFKGATKKSLDGMDYWSKGSEAFFIPSDRLVVLTRSMNESELGTIMKSKSSSVSPELRALAGQVDRNSLWLAMAWDDGMRKQMAQAAAKAPPEMQNLARSLSSGTGMTMSVNVDANVKVSLGVAVGSNAGQVAKDAETAWTGAAAQAAGLMFLLPNEAQGPLAEAMKNIKFNSEGNVARVTTEVKLDTLEKLAPQLNPGMMK